MKRCVAMSVVCAMMLTGVTGAWAQSEKPKEQIVHIDGMIIDGGIRKPDLHKGSAQQRAKFNRLSRLKKSMLKQVIETSEDDALK